ncbi:contact-dependent growth inhibition system immunity protein [Actinomycetospora straminea]|uniref:CdiI immunity protein domain-containing protein n=1 Tax=Actinomycetospora straminea TaxID=663607 RepID=A0ABP9EVD1_9PSEU|nr:contact-dependent growth inhibition system immunity protein [Actinomycetospora straminea]MDD7935433.1 contact-dependent growth inhibition system immunity protein [Actinomycetospora straminea]
MEIDLEASSWSGLRTLLGAYFNQDFEDIFGSPTDTVRAFCRDAPSERVLNAADGARRILDDTGSDEEALRAVEQFGLDYHPEAEGWQMREWLAELERLLRDPDGPTRLNWPHESAEGTTS